MDMKSRKSIDKKYKLEPFAYYIYSGIISIFIIFIIFQYLVTTPYIQSQENLLWYRRFLYFDYMFLLFFSITAFFSGIFLTYVGFGGNKKMGIYFIILGILVFILGFYYFEEIFPRAWNNPSNVYQALVSVLGTISGFIISIIITFIVITRIGPQNSNLNSKNKKNKISKTEHEV